LSEQALDEDFDTLLRRIAEAVAGGLDAEFCGVLESAPDGASLRMRAAHGENPPGEVEMAAGSDFGRLLMAGGAIALTNPLIVSRVPRWLLDRRMANGISHRIGGRKGGFGVLCAFSAGNRQFDPGDFDFVRAAANLAAMAARLDHGGPGTREASPKPPQPSALIAAFLASTSHEIRNPLHVILGYNEIIADHLRERGDSLAAPFLDAVERAGRRLAKTVDRLLAYSRLQSGVVETRPADTALAPLIEAIMREFTPRAAAKGIALTATIEEPAMAVRCDPDYLAGALENLADNAIKFTEHGEVAIRLYREPSGGAAIIIRDTGVGIDPAYLPRLFEPFSQEQSGYSRKFEGSGLGLALARRYLEMNWAEITVESEKGAGSTFTIHLRANARASD
jgi:signal transduction histidine kinase